MFSLGIIASQLQFQDDMESRVIPGGEHLGPMGVVEVIVEF